MPNLRNVLHHSRESEEQRAVEAARVADRLANLFSDRLDNSLRPGGAVPIAIAEADAAAVGTPPVTEPAILRSTRRRAMGRAALVGLEPAGDRIELVGVMAEPSEAAPEWVIPGNAAEPNDVVEARPASVETPARRALSPARSRKSIAPRIHALRLGAKGASDLVELVGVMAQPCDDVATPDLALVEGGLEAAPIGWDKDLGSAPEAASEAPEANQLSSATLRGAVSPGLAEPAETAPTEAELLEPADARPIEAVVSPALDEPAETTPTEAELLEPPQAPVPEPSLPPLVRSRRTAHRAESAPVVRRRSTAKPKTKKAVIAASAACPYCGMLLQPPPVASGRCARCSQRILVKRVEGRTIYLTEAALVVFEAERRRQASSPRFVRERARWLKLAEAAAAPQERIARLAAALPSEEAVAAARTLYMSTTDRAFRAAKRDHNWEIASRIRRRQAADLFRIAGSPMPPPADLVALFREGVTAELRCIAEMSRNAELVSAACCDVCRADDRRVFRISVELREPRLPHKGCPRGFCRCGWTLAAGDRTAIRHYIRRGARTEPRA
jgi:hypothetical protein